MVRTREKCPEASRCIIPNFHLLGVPLLKDGPDRVDWMVSGAERIPVMRINMSFHPSIYPSPQGILLLQILELARNQ